jgi:hypothetical protein
MTHKGLHHRLTESLVHSQKARFFPCTLNAHHPQLRNLISAVDRDWLYYATNHEIYTLHIPSTQVAQLKTIPFLPRCLAAGLGWVCVGGESHGLCAIIQLNDQDRDEFLSVDAPLPTDALKNSPKSSPPSVAAEANGSTLSNKVSVTTPSPFRWRSGLRLEELGGDIVNSITIHRLSSHGVSKWDEPVALLSNNDKTVKIYSLVQQKVIADLFHPFAMNYGLISPDSEVLATVGDGNRAFFYRRSLVRQPTASKESRYAKYEWQLFAIPKLPIGDRMRDDYSFSIAFSPSGHLCAVSSQGGMISVFDMDILENLSDDDDSENARLCMFKSGQTAPYGCIRSMAFSPAPWDLLAFAEDHGQAGVIDVRQSCCRKQVLQLDVEDTRLNKVELKDLTHDNLKNMDTYERLLLQYRQRMTAENGPTVSPIEHALMRGVMQAHPMPLHAGLDLDARERTVLDPLDATMEEVYEAPIPPTRLPYTLNFTSSPRVRASLESDIASPHTGVDHYSPGPDDLRRQMHNIQQEQRELIRTVERQYLPRRRSSVVLSRSATENDTLAPRALSRNRLTASPSQLQQADDSDNEPELPPLMSTNDLTATVGGSSSQPLPYDIPPSNPWHVIQTALDTARAADNSAPTSPNTIARLEAALAAERRLSLTSNSRPETPALRSNSAQTSALPTTSTTRPVTRDPRRYMDDALQRAISTRESMRDSIRESERDLASLRRQTPRDSTDTPPTTLSTSHSRAEIVHHQRILDARAQARQRGAAIYAAANSRRASRVATDDRSEPGQVLRNRHGSIVSRIPESMIEARLPDGTMIVRPHESPSGSNLRSLSPGTMARREEQHALRRAEINAPRTVPVGALPRFTDEDMRRTRQMFMTRVGLGEANMDRNGNWVAGDALERSHLGVNTGDLMLVDAMHEQNGDEAPRSVGTAGVGWSPDGRSL